MVDVFGNDGSINPDLRLFRKGLKSGMFAVIILEAVTALCED